MLTIRYSPDWKYNETQAVSSVCESTVENGEILLVPEQRSFDTEWLLCEHGGDRISRFAEVLSFTRLASRVLSVVGGCAVPTLEKSGRLIAMAGALEQIRSRLKIYGSHVTKPEFLLQLLQVVDEFKGYGVRPEAVQALPLEGTLAQKMEELCLIVESYESLCGSARQDPASRLDLLTDALWESDYAAKKRFTVAGFTDFTGQELAVLEALLCQARDVTVYLTLDHVQKGMQVFSVPRQTAADLLKLAKKHGISARTERLAPEAVDSPLSFLAGELFSSGRSVWDAPAPELSLFTAQSAGEEVLNLTGCVQALIRGGLRYRDLAVVCTSMELYRPLLEVQFFRGNIPCYVSGNSDILAEPVIRSVLAALEAASTGMEPDTVAEYLKSGISGLSADACDLLENYAFTWKLRGRAWDKPFTLHPDGFRKERTDDSDARLARLEEYRQLAVVPLLKLRAALSGAACTEAQVLALADFLEEIGLERRLGERVNTLQAEGAFRQAQEYAQLYEILSQTMEQIYGVLGQTQRTPEEFFRFFRCALSRHSIGTIPASLDCVRVGDLSSMRGARAKVLLLLGADAGSFPAADGEHGLLSDAERRVLKQAGLPVAPDDAMRLDRSLLTIYTLLTAPTERLYVSCSEGSESYLFSRLRAMFPQCGRREYAPLPVSALSAASAVAALPEAMRGDYLAKLPELRDAEASLRERLGYSRGQLSSSTVQGLYGQTLRLSASKIDRFASCRLAYFLNYGIKAKELRPAEVDAPIYGTLVHWVLEQLVCKVMEEGGFAAATEERLSELTQHYIRDFVTQELGGLEENGARAAYVIERSFDEILKIVLDLWTELRQSAFVPAGVEVRFAGAQAITVHGALADCVITGFVDRVDLYKAKDGQTYLRVIDYKTGKKTLDYTDILNGVGLQMLIYLFALTGGESFGDALPAGVLYVPARYPVINKTSKLSDEELAKERAEKLRRSGLVLQNAEILQAMEPADAPVYLPITLGRNGRLRGRLATDEGFTLLKQFVTRQLADMTDALFSGDLTPNPYSRSVDDSSCTYCEFKAVCHVTGGSIPVRKLKTTPPELFWEKVEQEVLHRG